MKKEKYNFILDNILYKRMAWEEYQQLTKDQLIRYIKTLKKKYEEKEIEDLEIENKYLTKTIIICMLFGMVFGIIFTIVILGG